MSTIKTQSPRIALFLAQPTGALVGESKPFKDHLELCRWAWDQGYQAVTAPACLPFVDITKVLTSKDYGADLLGTYAEAGTPLIRMEMHTVGQRMLMHPAELARYKMFANPALAGMTVIEHEKHAEQEALDIVEASARLGFKHLVTFSGNRGWTAAQYPWTAFPPQWRLHILLLALLKHRRVLASAAHHGIKVGFELHPEEDLNSPLLLYLFRELARQIAPETVSAIFANGDASHPTLIKDDSAEHFSFLKEHRLLGMCHLKDGETGEDFLPADSVESRGGSLRGDFAPRWSESQRRFCTFGTGDADWASIIPILIQTHMEQPEGLDFVIEGECSRFPNMMQGLKIAVENARLAIAGKALTQALAVEPEASIGGNWEDFCTGPVPAPELLYMGDNDKSKVKEMIRALGDSPLLKYF